MAQSRIAELLDRYETDLVNEWVQAQGRVAGARSRLSPEAIMQQSREFMSALRDGVQRGDLANIGTSEWSRIRDHLARLSRERAEQGESVSSTAMFVFSLKQVLFERLRREYSGDPAILAEEIWNATLLLDKLGLFTTEVAQKSRDEMIMRQQQDLLELSTPVVRLWDGILALPLIGTLDSARTQIVMENLLEAIVNSGAAIAIIDITGVPTVDTLVAQHLLKTVAAARLMGADCIISGIRPQIAQTIIHLGVELTEVTTKANLADAFQVALRRIGLGVVKTGKS